MQQLPLRLQQAPLLLRAEEAEEARRAQAVQVFLSAAPRPRRAAPRRAQGEEEHTGSAFQAPRPP